MASRSKQVALILMSIGLLMIGIYFAPKDLISKFKSRLNGYVKEISRKDRGEMHNNSEELNKIIGGLKKKIEDELVKRIEDLEEKLNVSNEVIKASDNKLKSSEEKIKILEEKIISINEKNENMHFMYKEAIIHQDIIEVLDKGLISKLGEPISWDDHTYREKQYSRRKMINIGVNTQVNGNGLKVNVPEGYDVLWLRVTNHKRNIFRIAALDAQDEVIEKYSCFSRSLNEISPDGTSNDGSSNSHKWCAMPLHQKGNYIVYTENRTDGWVSGLSFGKNIWHHARNDASAYHFKINGGSSVNWVKDNKINDFLAFLAPKTIGKFIVPVVPSGKDKLLYFVEYNNNWDSVFYAGITVNSKSVEGLRTTYLNPFATHFNSKFYQRYMATRIPKELIADDAKFLTVYVDMSLSDTTIYFREIGTHDWIE
jgi:hypothetical protein